MIRFTIFLVCFSLLVGCSEKPIAVQTVPVDRSNYRVFRVGGTGDQVAEKSPTRMIVGWFSQPEATWFVKIQGPEKEVNADDFIAFLKTVTFSGSRPVWQLPDNWQTGATKPMRFATLLTGGPRPLEIAISKLRGQQNRLSNVNRWLGQLELPKASQDQLPQLLKQDPEGDFLLFDAVGQGSGQMGGPFTSGASAPPQQKTSRRSGAESIAMPTISYALPKDWTDEKITGMVPGIRFSFAAAPTVVITATNLPASKNNWPSNVQRWCNQVGQTMTAEAIDQATQSITIDQHPAQLIKIPGVDGQDVLGAMTVNGEDAWFFKMKAASTTVQHHKSAFLEILQSVRFP